MAGFFLANTNNKELKIQKALESFRKCGMRLCFDYNLGQFKLYLFPKITEDRPSIFNNESGLCVAVGAYIYKGLNYTDSLQSTFEDYINDCLDLSQMYGQYTLILYGKSRVSIISDALNAKHIFSDNKFSFFTSSFFAATEAIGNITINDMAVLEKMLTGIIISPDTLANEVIQINKTEQKRANRSNCGVNFFLHPDLVIPPLHNCGLEASVNAQVNTINKYFLNLKNAFDEERVDLGLSAGHDSSLIFASLAKNYNNLHIHTHSTGHVHDREKNAAVSMAKVKGYDTTIIPTPRLDESDIELQKLLIENLYFFDGRTSHDIGGFSATYRAEYRLKATDNCKTTLTGVGGECLRNHYSVRGKVIEAKAFFEDKIFNRSFIKASPKELISTVADYHIKKAERILKLSLRGKINRLCLRRYYSEVLMPEGQGNVIDAYNTVSKCIAPFLDPHILVEAYRGMNYLGNCGEYESKIICVLDSDVGSCVNANNGYPFDNIPISLRFKEAIRASVSTRTWEMLNRIKSIGIRTKGNDYFERVLDNSIYLNDSFNQLKTRYPRIDFSIVVKGYAMDALVEYLALTMRKLTDE